MTQPDQPTVTSVRRPWRIPTPGNTHFWRLHVDGVAHGIVMLDRGRLELIPAVTGMTPAALRAIADHIDGIGAAHGLATPADHEAQRTAGEPFGAPLGDEQTEPVPLSGSDGSGAQNGAQPRCTCETCWPSFTSDVDIENWYPYTPHPDVDRAKEES